MSEVAVKSSIVTPIFRLAFPRVFTPTTNSFNEPTFVPKYEITMLFPKPRNPKAIEAMQAAGFDEATIKASMDLGEIRRILSDAAKKKWGDKLTGNPADPASVQAAKAFRAKLHNPIRDADAEEKATEGYAGMIFIKASNKNKIAIVDAGKVAVSDQSRVYGGMFCRALINAYAYDNRSKGVAFGLQALQLARDGKPFVGVADPDKAFSEIEAPSGGKDDPNQYPTTAEAGDVFANA